MARARESDARSRMGVLPTGLGNTTWISLRPGFYLIRRDDNALTDKRGLEVKAAFGMVW
jgi:hypothetical protein